MRQVCMTTSPQVPAGLQSVIDSVHPLLASLSIYSPDTILRRLLASSATSLTLAQLPMAALLNCMLGLGRRLHADRSPATFMLLLTFVAPQSDAPHCLQQGHR